MQELRNNLTISVSDKPGFILLGPMGDLDPTTLINYESARIPFKQANMKPSDWKEAFRTWTGYTQGWKTWYYRIAEKRRVQWEVHNISQCITLSLSDMAKNESLLIAASYFWSDALNAFLFGHGLMTPTLADVFMLTGLDISSSDCTF